MRNEPKQGYSLCPDCSECPSVEILDNGNVRIGEPPNFVALRREEWNVLVRAIQAGPSLPI